MTGDGAIIDAESDGMRVVQIAQHDGAADDVLRFDVVFVGIVESLRPGSGICLGLVGIDLGPEGGSGGGRIVTSGTPEQVADFPASHTGRFLQKALPWSEARAAV